MWTPVIPRARPHCCEPGTARAPLMREIHAKGVKFTRFQILKKFDLPGFLGKIGLASTMLKIAMNDVDSANWEQ